MSARTSISQMLVLATTIFQAPCAIASPAPNSEASILKKPLVLTAASQVPTRQMIEYYDSKKKIKRAKYTLVNNKKQGIYLEYYPNGVVKKRGVYLNGDESGKFTTYDEDGNVESKTDYVKGEAIHTISFATSNQILSEARLDGKGNLIY